MSARYVIVDVDGTVPGRSLEELGDGLAYAGTALEEETPPYRRISRSEVPSRDGKTPKYPYVLLDGDDWLASTGSEEGLREFETFVSRGYATEIVYVEEPERVTVTLHPADKTGTEWVAWTGNTLHRPVWNSREAAEAYADAVNAGTRKAEV